MRHEDILKEKVGKKLPYTVPEGYFKSFKQGIMEKLPEYPEKPKQKDLTVWHKIRPYIYLAAMFAGIWCMMQVFHHVSTASQQRTDEYAFASFEPDSYDLYVDDSEGQDLELQDEVTSLYSSFDDFKKDFYAQAVR